jgi:hypothetical protein
VQLPFTRTDFFDVFAAYNAALWPAAPAPWLVSLGLVIAAVRASEPPHRALSGLLAIHWAWSAVAYHAAFFTRINPAAWLFAGLFLVQAAVFAWFGAVRGRLRFSRGGTVWHLLGGALVAFALAYPLINLSQGLAFPRVPTFGVPCPTTIFTAGLLLTATTPSWSVAAIPVLWSIIRGVRGASARRPGGPRTVSGRGALSDLLVTFMATGKGHR